MVIVSIYNLIERETFITPILHNVTGWRNGYSRLCLPSLPWQEHVLHMNGLSPLWFAFAGHFVFPYVFRCVYVIITVTNHNPPVLFSAPGDVIYSSFVDGHDASVQQTRFSY